MSGRSVMSAANGHSLPSLGTGSRVYCLCRFEQGAVVPAVKLIDAASDEQAVAIARASDPGAEREVWDRHRLVAHLPALAGFA